jgi:protein CpxP
MNRTQRFTAASALLAATMAMPVAGWAQTQEGPQTPVHMPPSQQSVGTTTTAPASPTAGHTPQAASILKGVEQHIRELHSELKITQAQEPQWEQFAQVMRGNAQAMSDSLDQRAQQIAQMNAVDDMTTYAQLAEQRSQDLVKLAGAFQTLYGTFSDQQKQNADQLFRRQAEVHAEKPVAKHAS